jgi:hypothetical protein
VEVEIKNVPPFLVILVRKRGFKLAINSNKKPTHTGHYLHFKYDRPHDVKKGVVCSLVCNAKVICEDQKDFKKEIPRDAN